MRLDPAPGQPRVEAEAGHRLGAERHVGALEVLHPARRAITQMMIADRPAEPLQPPDGRGQPFVELLAVMDMVAPADTADRRVGQE